MSAERLREAAKELRAGAEGAIESLHGSHDWHGIGTGYREPIKAHIQSMSPVAALAVADWLDVTARDVGTSTLSFHAAKKLADTILGDPDA